MKREEMAKQGHGRGNAHHGLTNEGEDGKENEGLWIQMQRMDLVMREYGVEEIRERGDQASQESMKMDGDLSGCHVDHGTVSRPSHRRIPLVGIGGEHRTDHVQHFLIDHR